MWSERSQPGALSSLLGEPGVWMVSADSILQADVVTGVGVARSPGIATIFHDIPGVVKTYREVNPTTPGLPGAGGWVCAWACAEKTPARQRAHASSVETAARCTAAWREAASSTRAQNGQCGSYSAASLWLLVGTGPQG